MSADTSPKQENGQRPYLMTSDELKSRAILLLCESARRSPDKFIRRGTRWLTAYEFFVCDQSLFEKGEITLKTAQAFSINFPWRVDQIYNGLKSPDQEPME